MPGPDSTSPLWSKTAKLSPCLSVRGRRSCSEAAAGTENCAGGPLDPAGALAIGSAPALCLVGSSAYQPRGEITALIPEWRGGWCKWRDSPGYPFARELASKLTHASMQSSGKQLRSRDMTRSQAGDVVLDHLAPRKRLTPLAERDV